MPVSSGICRDLENQLRSLLKENDILFRRAIGAHPSRARMHELADAGGVCVIMECLLTVHERVTDEQARLDLRVREMAKADQTTRRHNAEMWRATFPHVCVGRGYVAARFPER